jgi:hypothetical protein
MSDEKPKKTSRARGAKKRTDAATATASPIEDQRSANQGSLEESSLAQPFDDQGSAERVVPVPQTSEIGGQTAAAQDTAAPEDSEEEIRRRAYELYLSRGGANGDDLSDWLEAERLVRSRRGSEAGHAENIPSNEQRRD